MSSTWRPPLAAGIALIFLALAASPDTANAQFFKNLKKTVKEAAESETNSQVDKIVRGSVQCAFDNLQCINNAEKSGQDVVLTDDEGEVLLDKKGNPVSDPEEGARIAEQSGGAARPGEGAPFRGRDVHDRGREVLPRVEVELRPEPALVIPHSPIASSIRSMYSANASGSSLSSSSGLRSTSIPLRRRAGSVAPRSRASARIAFASAAVGFSELRLVLIWTVVYIARIQSLGS